MKTIIQSLIASFITHILYFGGMMLVGYIQTKKYVPDINHAWEDVEVLQNEVAFGAVGSPLFFIFTFVGVALVSGLIIFLYKKMVRS